MEETEEQPTEETVEAPQSQNHADDSTDVYRRAYRTGFRDGQRTTRKKAVVTTPKIESTPTPNPKPSVVGGLLRKLHG